MSESAEITERVRMERVRLERAKNKAVFKCNSIISRIRAIHSLSLRVLSDTAEIPRFLVAAESLDRLGAQFEAENDCILDCLIALDAKEGYSPELFTEISEIIDASKAVAKTLSNPISGTPNAEEPVVTRSSGSPKIPLPSYGGDLSGWPIFRDSYVALVVNRPELSNIDRFYNLLGCLTGEALDTIKNIPVSDSTYELAWSTLVKRFDKSQQLATMIVDKLMSAPMHSEESLDGLKDFLVLFSDHVAVLKSLNIPSLGELLLFAMSLRCLPLSTRKTFEEINKNEFPSIADIVLYVKTRVALLEAVGCSSISKRPTPASNQLKRVFRLGVKAICYFCAGTHTLVYCDKFIKLSLDDRIEVLSEKKICFRCLNAKHLTVNCKRVASCSICFGRHHTLLHQKRPSTSSVSDILSTPSIPPSSLISSMNATTVLLGTALVHVQDRSGCMRVVRALLDSGSQISAVTTSCVDRLGLKPKKWTAPLVGMSGVPIPTVSGVIDCLVAPRYSNDPSIDMHAWIMPKLTADMPSQNLPISIRSKFSHLALADPNFDRSAPIDMLLGADVFPRVLDGKCILVDESFPPAYGSIFGWILIGIVKDKEHQSLPAISLTVYLEGLVQRFWQLEKPEDAPVMLTDDGQCEFIHIKERCRDATV